MFEYTKTQVAEMAEEMNYVRDTLEKVLRLSEILRCLNENPLMKEHLALKGGTAINLTVFDLPRLSVDVDLDFEKKSPARRYADAARQNPRRPAHIYDDAGLCDQPAQ